MVAWGLNPNANAMQLTFKPTTQIGGFHYRTYPVIYCKYNGFLAL